MQLLGIQEPGDSTPPRRLVPFALGFRPFFLGAGIAAVILMGLWLAVYRPGGASLPFYYGPSGWHGHEMLFGYAAAVIAGFLLTAVRNWTGFDTPSGKPLAALVALWLTGRVLPCFPETLPHGLIALVDMAFLPAVGAALAGPLWRSKQMQNLGLLLLLGMMTVANLLVHLEALGLTRTTHQAGLTLGLNMVVLFMVIIGGRVIPFFTERGLPGAITKTWKPVEWLAMASVIALALGQLFALKPEYIGVLAALAALGNGLRLSGWYSNRIWSVPLLWVLHLGYAWLVTGFILQALAAAGLVMEVLAMHAFTAGGIGVITLGMMSRVALGHTGRPLEPARIMTLAFALINLAALVRVVAPLIVPQWYGQLILLSGGLWIAAFLIFVIVYTPILLKPRLDGRPG